MSDLEDLLAWQLKAAKVKYEREYRFHPTRRWRFDFAFLDSKIGVEVDGGGWVQGRHHRPLGAERDADKGNAAILEGWRVLHFTARHVKSGEALQTILEALKC